MSKVKCKICKSEILKVNAYKFKARSYCCNKDEFEIWEKEKNEIENSRNLIFSLFNTKLTTGNIIFINSAMKRIIDNYGHWCYVNLMKDVNKICLNNAKITTMSQSNKARYIVAIMNNHIEQIVVDSIRMKSEKPIENKIEDDIVIKSVTTKSKSDISNLLDL